MANEILPRDPNLEPVAGGATADGLRETRPFLVDPTTGRLLVDNQGAGGTPPATAPQRTILDYDARVDANPVYVGTNAQTALVGAATWTVKKLFYDSTARLIDAQVLTGSWTGRAALGWRTAAGD